MQTTFSIHTHYTVVFASMKAERLGNLILVLLCLFFLSLAMYAHLIVMDKKKKAIVQDIRGGDRYFQSITTF